MVGVIVVVVVAGVAIEDVLGITNRTGCCHI